MLLAIALPVGVVLDRLTGGWENLSGSFLILMGWLDSPTMLQRHAAGMVSHLVVPALLVFLVLKATRLGAWLAPNRLAIGCLLVADAVLVGMAVRSLVLASIGEPPFVSGALAAVATPVVVASLAAGLVALLASTIWHRMVSDKGQAVNRCTALLREV
jgi:hypothetical protein